MNHTPETEMRNIAATVALCKGIGDLISRVGGSVEDENNLNTETASLFVLESENCPCKNRESNQCLNAHYKHTPESVQCCIANCPLPEQFPVEEAVS